MLNIKQRQMNLQFLGYYNDKIDGIEGKNTKQAYRDFQKAYGLTVDGIYGVKTEAKLVEVIKKIQTDLGVAVDGIAGVQTKSAYNNKQNSDNNLSWDDIKHFKQSEFACKCGCGFNSIDLKLLKILDEIREHFGKPLTISSGCRCATHNAKVGGVKGSRHVLGKASDIWISGVSKNDLMNKCKEYVSNGQANYTYSNESNMKYAVHIDVK